MTGKQALGGNIHVPFGPDERVKKKRVKKLANHKFKRDKTKITKGTLANETEEQRQVRVARLKEKERVKKAKRK